MDIDIRSKYYIRKSAGGYSPCIEGNGAFGLRPFPGSTLPNCVAWATGRMNERLNIGSCKYLGNRNAKEFTIFAKQQGLEMGDDPVEGACMVWGGSGEGHVAIVESVIDNDTVKTSESGWSYRAEPIVRELTRKRGSGNWGQSYEFLCFIYPPGYKPDPKPERLTYKIKWGDTLSKIAVKFHVTVQELCQWNNISNPNRIYAGDVIYVSPPEGDFIEYKIKRGDTLSAIAKNFSTTIKQIMEDNPFIKDPNKIYAGDVIKIRRKK